MPIQRYDFVTGVESDTMPSTSAGDAVGDALVLGLQNSFTIADNQSSAANVTSALFDKTVYRAVWLEYSIYRSASGGSTRAQTGLIRMVTDGTNWEIDDTGVSVPSSDDAGVDFSVTSSGQLQYVSDANGGSYLAATSVMKWKINALFAV